MEEDAALFGLTLPDIAPQEEAHFEVIKSNWPILKAFIILDNCAWQYTGMGDLIGINFEAAHIIWGYTGITLNQEEFLGLMLFAKTVVNELNKRKKP